MDSFYICRFFILAALSFLAFTVQCQGDNNLQHESKRKMEDSNDNLLEEIRIAQEVFANASEFYIQSFSENALAVIPRRDPLKSFKYYRGGFNATDKHYWASVIFTGVWAYALVLFSLILGIFLISALYWAYFSSHKQELSHNGNTLYGVIIFVVTIAFLAGGSMSIFGTVRLGKQFNGVTLSLINAVDSVVSEVNHIAGVLRNATGSIDLDRDNLTESVVSTLNDVESTALKIQKKVSRNKSRVYTAFNYAKIGLLVYVLVLFVSVICGFVFYFFSWRFLCAMICIFLTYSMVVSWLLSGIGFSTSNIIGDTCLAMHEYNESPSNSTLSSLLPCMEGQKVLELVNHAKSLIDGILTKVNTEIDEVKSSLPQTSASRIPTICNPLNASSCASNAFSYVDTIKLLQSLACDVNQQTECLTKGKPLMQSTFQKIQRALDAVSRVLAITPQLLDLLQCRFVTLAFQNLVQERCEPSQMWTNWIWAAFVLISVASLVLSVVYFLFSRTAPSFVRLKPKFPYAI